MTTAGQGAAAVQREGKASLVDIAEEALRNWLATGRHRPGERLPPEQELSAHLGISRGTLRTALQRLEDSGEIVRRQGSGTYVGRAVSTSLDEGLEKLLEPFVQRGRDRSPDVGSAPLPAHDFAAVLQALQRGSQCPATDSQVG